MKTIQRVILAGVIVFACTAWAETIFLNSQPTLIDPRQTNSVSPGNVAIVPHTVWNHNGAGIWISFADTGEPRAVQVPSIPGASLIGVPANANFFLGFDLPYDTNTGSVTVWADDTARVWLDGVILFEANPVQGGACAISPIGCMAVNGETFDLSGLAAGSHLLQMDVYQRANGPYGVQYMGEIVSIPEPTTELLLGLGLVVLGWCVRRRRGGQV